MTAEVAGLVLRATLLVGTAWLAAALLKKAGAPAAARHMAWLLGIAALLALPLLSSLVPALNLPILPPEAPTGSAPMVAAPQPVLAAHESYLLPFIYALGAVALLLRLVIGRRMLERLWRAADIVPDAAWEALLARLSAKIRLSRPVELRIARGPVMPMTWGTLAPKLLLPAEAVAWPAERRRLVLLHELAHVARRDSLSRSIASLACALYWFHPGAWFAARQMRIEQEHAADDCVLAAGGCARAYARNLLHLARRAGEGRQPAHVAAMAGMAQLERRLVSITVPARRDPPGPAFLASSAVFACLAALVVAVTVPVHPPSLLPNPFQAEQASIPTETLPPAARPDEQPFSTAAPPSQRHAPVQRQESVAIPTQVVSAAEAPASAAPLPNYGWQLSQKIPKLDIGTLADRPSADRMPKPTPLPPTPTVRITPPKWARTALRLVVPDTATRTSPPVVRGPVMLSLSVDTNAPR